MLGRRAKLALEPKAQPKMNSKRCQQLHLALNEFVLKAGMEWQPQSSAWTMIQLRAGAGYWISESSTHPLETFSVLLVGRAASGRLLASQLANVQFGFFRIEAERMTGLATLNEQRYLESAASRQDALHVFSGSHPIAARFGELYSHRHPNSLAFRLDLLRLFVDGIGGGCEHCEPNPASPPAAKERLRKTLGEMTASELLEVTFADLARRMNCTPRHLSRIFSDVVGMSFREKQAKIRLGRARELLATTETKVVDVALESGFQSPSLFNLMFRRRFGMSPGQWRRRNQASGGKRRKRLLV